MGTTSEELLGDFNCAPDRRRWRQTSPYATGKEITIYAGALLEKLSTPVRKHWKHRIPTPSGEVQVIRRNDGTSETFYFANDHLGSVDAVLNAAGAVVSRPSFNAWGARRGSNWQGAPSSTDWQAIADTTRRGYTGHEHLDNVMLVHMNGRVYDPAIGRFLSADPYIDCAQDMAGWNRYSYVKNRPLSFTDPSGYSTAVTRGMSLASQVKRIEFGPRGDGGAGSNGGAGGGVRATVVVTASRLQLELNAVFQQLDLTEMLRGLVPMRASYEGGGGRSGGNAAGQREDEHRKCVQECKNDYEGAIQTLAGIFGGAVGGAGLALQTGNIPGLLPAMGAGAVVGGVTGAASGFMTQAARSGGADGLTASVLGAATGAPVGYTATAYAQGGSATFGGAMVGAASGAAGALVPGSGGAAASSGISSLAATQFSRVARGLSGLWGAATAAATYHALDVARSIHCESQCSGP